MLRAHKIRLNPNAEQARHLARHIADAGWGELRRQLAYKAQQRGVQLRLVDRWYPSSKTCSACEAVNGELTLGQRRWTCAGCGAEHDRDVNAAKNILRQSLRMEEETSALGARV